MTLEARDLWQRAETSLKAARALLSIDPDSAASRAYYAAFHGVCALFCSEDKTFTKHSAVLAAVHRDLVNTGRWSKELGADYSSLQVLRQIGDYGGDSHVDAHGAERSVRL
ncbi:MAG: HEPN domain-containing protein [Deltaproteobacteria bacterium]|nr:HEPN domain-containing protein [Deltaproteobacteria bacterium]